MAYNFGFEKPKTLAEMLREQAMAGIPKTIGPTGGGTDVELDDVALSDVQNRELAKAKRAPLRGMKSIQDAASPTWGTALAKTLAAGYIRKKGKEERDEDVAGFEKSMQATAKKEARSLKRSIRREDEGDERLRIKEERAVRTEEREIEKSKREAEEALIPSISGGDFYEEDGEPGFMYFENGKLKKKKGLKKPDSTRNRSLRSGGKPSYGGRGTLQNMETGEQIEGSWENGILMDGDGKRLGTGWVSDPNIASTFSDPEVWYDANMTPTTVYESSNGGMFTQDQDGSVRPANLFGMTDIAPKDMSATQLKLLQGEQKQKQGREDLSGTLKQIAQAYVDFEDTGLAKTPFGKWSDEGSWGTAAENFGKTLMMGAGIQQAAGSGAGQLQDLVKGLISQAVPQIAAGSGMSSTNWNSQVEQENLRNTMGKLGQDQLANIKLIEGVYDKYGGLGPRPDWLVDARRKIEAARKPPSILNDNDQLDLDELNKEFGP